MVAEGVASVKKKVIRPLMNTFLRKFKHFCNQTPPDLNQTSPHFKPLGIIVQVAELRGLARECMKSDRSTEAFLHLSHALR